MDVGQLMVSINLSISQFKTALNDMVAQAKAAAQQVSDALEQGPGKGLKKLDEETKNATSNIAKYFKDTGRIVSGIVISQTFYNALGDIKNATSALFKFYELTQNTQMAFSQFLGSAQAGQQFVQVMQKYAAVTPFTYEQVAGAAEKLMAVGFQSTQILPLLSTIGDTAAGLGGDQSTLNGIIHAIGQIQTMGHLQLRELNELAMHGVPAYAILEKQLGLTGVQIHNIGKMAIPAGVAIKALLTGMQEKYGGLMNKMQDTTAGMISTVQDDAKIIGTTLFGGFFNAFNNGLRSFRDWIDNLRAAAQAGGAQGILNALVPPTLRPALEEIIMAVEMLWKDIVQLWRDLQPLIIGIGGAFVAALMAALPLLTGMINILTQLLTWITQNRTAVEALAFAVTSLWIVYVATSWINKFVSAVKLMAVIDFIVPLLYKLRDALYAVTVALETDPVVFIITLITMAILGLAMTSQTASQWLQNLINKVEQLTGLGFKTGNLTPSADQTAAWNKYNTSLQSALNSLLGTGNATQSIADATKNAQKATKGWITSFDEVFNMPATLDSVNSALNNVSNSIPKIPKIPTLPNLPTSNPTSPTGDGNGNSSGNNNNNQQPWLLPPLKFPPGGGPTAVIASITAMVALALAKLKKFKQDALNEVLAIWSNVKTTWTQDLNDVVTILSTYALNMRNSWDNLWNDLSQSVVNFGTTIQTDFNNIVKAIETTVANFTSTITTAWNNLWNGAVQSVVNFGTTVQTDFNNIVKSVETATTNFTSTIATAWNNLWNGAVQSITNFETSVTNTIQSMIKSVETATTNFTSTITTAWNNLWNGALQEVMNLESNVENHFNSLISTVEAALKGFASTITTTWNNLWNGALQEVMNLENNVKTHFNSLITSIETIITGASTTIVKDWNGLLSQVKQLVQNTVKSLENDWNGLLANLETAINSAKEIIAKDWNAVMSKIEVISGDAVQTVERDWTALETSLTTLINSIKNEFVKVWNDISAHVTGITKNIVAAVEKIWNDHEKNITVIITAITAAIVKLFNDGVTNVSTSISNGITGIVKAIKGWLPDVKTATKSITSWIVNLFSNLGTDIVNAMDNIPTQISNKIQSILTNAKKILQQGLADLGLGSNPSSPAPAPTPTPSPTTKTPTPSTNLPWWFAAGAGALGAAGGGGSSAAHMSGAGNFMNSITAFAKGGILDRESIIRMAENGREAVVPLTGQAMQPFADAIAQRLNGTSEGGMGGTGGGQILHVGTLVADDRGLIELERRLYKIRLGENTRRGNV